jgi:hypothetical protein
MKNITKYVKQIPLLFALFAFLAINKLGAQSCVHTIQLTDTYGDGWNGGAVGVSVGGTAVTGLTNLTLASGFGPASYTFAATAGQTIRVYQTAAGSYASERRIKVINSAGTTIINTIQPVTGTASSGGTTGAAACTAPTPPANDLCANAVSLACASGNISGTTVNSVAETTGNGVSSLYGVWYKFTGDVNNTITTLSSTAGFDHEMTIYSGSCGALTQVATIDNSFGAETYSFTSVANQQYYVYVAHYSTTSTATGTFSISRTCSAPTPPPSPPANDLCANAVSLACASGNISGTTVNSVAETTGNGVSSLYGVWYKFNCDANNTITTISSAAAAGFDHEMTIYTGSCGALTQIATLDNVLSGGTETYSFTSVANQQYYVYIAHWSTSSTTTGAFTISRNCVAPPPPCNAPSSLVINGSPATTSATVFWTAAAPAPSLGYDVYLSTSSFAPTGASSPLGTVATAGTNLTGLIASTTYYVWVRSKCASNSTSSWVGPLVFTTASIPPPANDNCSGAINMSCGGQVTVNTANATTDAIGNTTCGTFISTPGVWYQIAGNGQDMTVSTVGLTSTDTKLMVYSGSCAGLTCVGGSDDFSGLQSQVSWSSVSGTTYYVLAATFSGTGSFPVSLTCTTPYNPCSNISSIANCGVAANVNIPSGNGSWNSFGGLYSTPGKEQLFSYTPSITASYEITVTNNSSGWIDLFYKASSSGCNNTGWTYVDDISGTC